MNESDQRMSRLPPRGTPAFLRSSDASMLQREWPAEVNPGAKLQGVWRALLRHAWLIVFTLLCVNAVAIAIVMRLPPRYSAEAAVLIGPREAQVTDMKAVITGLTGESDVIESEMQVVRSRKLARHVVEELRLDRNPEFNPALAPAGLRQRIASALGGLFARAPAAPGETSGGQETPRDPLARTTDVFLRHLSVAEKGHSRVIGITVDAASPELAADAANAVAEAYIDQQLHAKTDATTHAHQWLEERVAELHRQSTDADKAVEEYRQKTGLLHGSNASLATEQISNIGQQIVEAQVERANASARLQTLTTVLASRSGLDGLNGLPEVQNSPLIRDLRQQETILTQQSAELSSTYLKSYPRQATLNAQIEAIRARERVELQRVADSLRDAVRTAEAREALLQPVLANLRKEVSASKEGEIELHSLQQEADADHLLYERLLSRSKETQIEVGLQQPDGQIISAAEPPDAPSFPNPTLMLPLLFVASCMMAALLVMGLESVDQGFSSMEQVETVLGVNALGVVPRIARRLIGRSSPYAAGQPDSAYSEAIRSLYTSLLLSGAGDHDSAVRAPKTVLFASANPDEGKTTIVMSLARLMAASGKRVVIVDCDIRRPSLHKAAGVARSPGLVDHLLEGTELATVLKQDPASGVWLLPAGEQRLTAPDLFASEGMNRLIRTLGEQFDLVLLDSAPVLLISDTRALARLVDETVFVARWNATKRLQVGMAIRQLADAGGNIAGVLLSMVDVRRYARQGGGGLNRRALRLYLAK